METSFGEDQSASPFKPHSKTGDGASRLELSVDLTFFVQDGYAASVEFNQVSAIADQLLRHLNSAEALRLIADVNAPGASSALVQGTFLHFARQLGFVDESRGLFSGYETSALRPDYYRPIGSSGILLEVERGKTTINNMDFLDFWKCHVCERAHYLFLMVPRQLRQNPTMRPRNEYAYVIKRLGSFFTSRNYTNVRGLFIFGY